MKQGLLQKGVQIAVQTQDNKIEISKGQLISKCLFGVFNTIKTIYLKL